MTGPHRDRYQVRRRFYDDAGQVRDFLIELEVDVDLLIERMGRKAARNPSGRSSALDGALKVKAIR